MPAIPKAPFKVCVECKNGDQEVDYGPIVGRFIVRDPDTGEIHLRGPLCGEHETALNDDGYTLTRL